MAQRCLACKLINPSDAQRCDCGYDFATQQMKKSYLQRKATPEVVRVSKGVLVAILLLAALRILMRLVL